MKVTIRVTQEQAYDVDAEWFGWLPEDATADELWEAVKTLYTDPNQGDPALAFEAVEPGRALISVTRQDGTTASVILKGDDEQGDL